VACTGCQGFDGANAVVVSGKRPNEESGFRRFRDRHVEVSDNHGVVVSADVTITQQTVRTARTSLRAAAGHLAPGSRARLVDAVLELPELHNDGRLEAAFPLGDSETPHQLCQRCTDVTTRPAGSTVLLEATIGPAIPPARVTARPVMRAA